MATGETEDVCRVCLGAVTAGEAVSLFGESPPLGEALRRHTGCQVAPEDGLPSNLCGRCAETLRSAEEFAALCRDSDRRLRLGLLSTPEAEEVTPEDGGHACSVCGRTFKCASALAVHGRRHTGERPHACRHCGRAFAQKGTLTEHVRRLHSEDSSSMKRFTCEVCGKRFMKRGDMRTHMRVHTEEKPYECDLCHRRFTQRGSLATHLMLHTGERPFPCGLCDKRFINRNTLARHMTVHSDERNYKCDLCQKPLKSRAAVKKHIVCVHTPERAHACGVCARPFVSKGNLTVHMKRRHSERSGECAVCGKHFSDLLDHSRLHTGETPFECAVCGRRFTLRRSLTAHVNRHRNAARLQCRVEGCKAAFPERRQLDYHILKHHWNFTPFSCEPCAKRFYRMSDFKKHMNGAHKNEDVTETNEAESVSLPLRSTEFIPPR